MQTEVEAPWISDVFPRRSHRGRSFCPRLYPDATNLQNNTLESEDKRLPQKLANYSLFSFFRTLSGCCCY